MNTADDNDDRKVWVSNLPSILSKFGNLPLVRSNSRSSLSKMASDEFYDMTNKHFNSDLAYDNDSDEHDLPLLLDPSHSYNHDADIVPSSQRRQINMTSFMRQLGHALATLIIVGLVIVIPLFTIYAVKQRNIRQDSIIYVSAGAFSLITVLISFREIYMHLTNFYIPEIQKYVVRILFFVPVYSVQSWLSLMFFDQRLFIDTARDLYEAYVIASFVYLIIELLGGETALAEILDLKDPHYGEHPYPFNYIMSPWQMGEQYLFECKYGALQYVVIKILVAFLIAILEPLGLYGEGSFQLQYAYIYIAFVINISQTYALYCLVKILHPTHEDLLSPVNWNPLGKAACVKLVVFFTWWQGIIIAFLQAQGIIHGIGTWDADHVSVTLQDYLIVLEMFFFAVAHTFAFSYREFLKPSNKNGEYDEYDNIDDGNEFDGDYAAYDTSSFDVRALNAPMRMGKALWQSSVPKETFNDINRLKSGIRQAMSQPLGIRMNVQDAESI